MCRVRFPNSEKFLLTLMCGIYPPSPSNPESSHLFLLHTNHLFVLIHHRLARLFLIFPWSLYSNPGARILLSPSTRCILVANLFSFSHCWISWIASLFTCCPSTYLISFCFTVILLNTTVSVAVVFHHPPCIRAAFRTTPSALNDAELALPRGGFRVAGSAYLRQIGRDKVYLFGELASQRHAHTHRHAQLKTDGVYMCYAFFSLNLHSINKTSLNSYHKVSLHTRACVCQCLFQFH